MGWVDYEIKHEGESKGQKYTTLCLCDEDSNFLIFITNTDQETQSFCFENYTGQGLVSEIELKGKKYVVAIAGRNTENDGFRMWVEDSIPTDKAETATDQYSLKNYDWADIFEGIYKPGYKYLWGKYTEEYKDWYDDIDGGFKTKLYNYNGVDFVIGGKEDCKDIVRTLDGKTMEPASKTYFKIMNGNKGERRMTLGYCFEGKVQIGDKKVTMAVVQCNGDSLVFLKE